MTIATYTPHAFYNHLFNQGGVLFGQRKQIRFLRDGKNRHVEYTSIWSSTIFMPRLRNG